MARDPYTEQRLLNWGRWKAGQGAGGLGFAGTNWEAFDGGDRYGTSAAVLPDGDDAITDEAVRSLDAPLQQLLERHYVLGGDFERKVADIGCHAKTYMARLNQACRCVSAWLAERAQRGQQERERIEAQQRHVSASLADRERLALAERARTDEIMGIKPLRVHRAKKEF